jgi:hypothetical protein
MPPIALHVCGVLLLRMGSLSLPAENRERFYVYFFCTMSHWNIGKLRETMINKHYSLITRETSEQRGTAEQDQTQKNADKLILLN